MTWSIPKSVEKSAVITSLGLYALLLAYVVPRHEPWADEAQAWELASSNGLTALFGKYIHYEGSPGLWHLLLWVLARLHVSYAGMHWFAALIALAGVSIFAIAAPFPLPVRVAVPFTYFFLYQYAVIARSYVLFPFLAFSLAYFWKDRWERPLPVACLLGLVGNISSHTFGAAVGLTIVLLIEMWQRRNTNPPDKSLIWPGVVLLTMLLFALWCILPASDAGWVVRVKEINSYQAVLIKVKENILVHPWMKFFNLRIQMFLTYLIGYIFALTRALSFRFHLGLVTWVLFTAYLLFSGQLRYMIPALILGWLCPAINFHFYHSGLVWVLFLALWWMTWPGASENVHKFLRRGMPQFRILITIAVSACILVQLTWAYAAVRHEIAGPYAPARDGARVLQAYLNRGNAADVAMPSPLDGEGSGSFYITGLEPYFATQPIANMPFRFWFWGWGYDLRPKYLQDSRNRSAVIIVEETDEDLRYRIEETRLISLGYRRDRVVCGQMYYPDMDAYRLCDAFYTP